MYLSRLGASYNLKLTARQHLHLASTLDQQTVLRARARRMEPRSPRDVCSLQLD